MTARKSWAGTLSAALVSGALASLASAAALALAGKRELDDAAAPLNGPSQWVWGRHAPYRGGFSARHTLVGYAVHHLASVFWATWFERLRMGRAALPAAIATASVACVVDFRCTPRRLTPGFERRLSRGALLMVYVAFGAGLAASVLRRRKLRRRAARRCAPRARGRDSRAR
jgi:hypothetical protein